MNTNEESTDRLYLGFDAACATCASIADDVREVTGDKLTPVSLSDKRMITWRRDLLGEAAPWTPTLVAVNGDDVRAYTGVEMGFRLQKELGMRTAWKIAQVLGGRREQITGKRSGLITRNAFMRGAVGTVFGLTLLSSTASPAAASSSSIKGGTGDHWLTDLEFQDSTQMSDDEASAAWKDVKRSKDFRRLAGGPSGKARKVTTQDASVRGVRHVTSGGGSVLAVSTQTDTALVVAYILKTKGGGSRTLIKLFEKTGEETMELRSRVDDGDLFDAASPESLELAARATCTSGTNCGICLSCQCRSWNVTCILNCCAPCAFACGAVWSCVGCAAIWCPACATINKCCTSRQCQPRPGCG